MSEYITKKKKKIDLGEIVSKALNKEGNIMADDISKKLDAKVKDMAIGNTLGNIIVTSKKLRDQLRKKDPVKAKAGLKTGGRAGLKGGGICKKGMNKKAIGKNS